MPPADRALLIRHLCAKHTVRTAAREARALTHAPTLRQLLAGLPEVPVVAVVGERADRGEHKARAALVDLFRNAMQRHPGGQFVAASRSGHYIPWQEPGLVAEAILQMVRTLRADYPEHYRMPQRANARWPAALPPNATGAVSRVAKNLTVGALVPAQGSGRACSFRTSSGVKLGAFLTAS